VAENDGRDAVYFLVPGSDRSPAVLQATFEPGRQPELEEFQALKAASLAAADVLQFTEPTRQKSLMTASEISGGPRVTSIHELRPTA
jgi:hypothetical protein